MNTATSPLATKEGEELLTGWGGTAPSRAVVKKPTSVEEVQEIVSTAGPRGVLARGLGRSYGDAAQDGGGTVINLEHLNTRTLKDGMLTAQAGASLDEILKQIVPAGYFVPVTPGTRMITVGGAIGADVHGKNHHRDGTFGVHVSELELVTGTGETKTFTQEHPEFWATVGGMGLTGVVTSATFDLIEIETSLMCVDTERANDLDAVMASMIAKDDGYRYSVAWIDSVATGANFGRGVITRGEHATKDQLPNAHNDPLAYDAKILGTAPKVFPSGVLNRWTVRAFNEAWFRKAPKEKAGELQSIGAFFHPLDGVQEWSRVYGPKGFLQYQFVVPDDAAHVVAIALKRLQAAGAPSFLTVLKRFGAANNAPLSFPQPGWTLAADVPAGIVGLDDALDELDELVQSEGGRLYLAKDSRMDPQMMQSTYPRLDEWKAMKQRMDPKGVFTSDLARRLSL